MSMYDTEAEKVLEQWAASKYAVLNNTSFGLPDRRDDGGILLDALFNRMDEGEEKKPSKVWDADGIHVPAPDTGLYKTGPILSKLTKEWPVFAVSMKLPTLKIDRHFRLQLETGHQGTAGECALRPESGLETEMNWRAHTGGPNHYNAVQLRVTNFLPGDYDTAANHYRFIRYRGGWLFTINNDLKGVILDGVPESVPKWENNPPYALGSITDSMGKEFQFKTQVREESDKPDYETGEAFTFELGSEKGMFGLWSGQPTPPRQFPLYNENTSTLWSGQTTDVAITSHPVPIWGYDEATWYFQSDSAGDVEIQVYVGGNWRTYYTKTLSANELLYYSMDNEVPIARAVYTPTDSDTLAVGEVHLG